MSIDFRTKKFNREIDEQIHGLNFIFDERIPLRKGEEEQELIARLNTLWKSFHEYYSKQDQYSEIERPIRANEVFSEYLQNTIYYLVHNAKDKVNAQKLMLTIVNHHEFPFFYVSEYDSKKKVVTWVDPKEEFTALTSAAFNGYDSIVEKIMSLAVKVFDQDKAGLIKYFLRANKHGYDALFAAARSGDDATFALVIKIAKEILTNKEDLKSLFKTQNQKKANVLNYCARSGYAKMVELIIQLAKEVLDKKELRDLLESIEEEKFTPLMSAVNKNSLEIVKVLNELAIEVYGEDKAALEKYLLMQNKNGYSAFISASRSASIEILREVYKLAVYTFKDNKEAMDTFLTQENKEEYSAFHAAIYEKREEIIEELINIAREFYAENSRKFLNFIYQKQKYEYTTLMTAAEKGDESILTLLLAELRKAEPSLIKFSNMINESWKNTGDTAVNVAAKKGKMETYNLLVDYGADVTIANKSGYSASDNLMTFRKEQQNPSTNSIGFFDKNKKEGNKRGFDSVGSRQSGFQAKRKK